MRDFKDWEIGRLRDERFENGDGDEEVRRWDRSSTDFPEE